MKILRIAAMLAALALAGCGGEVDKPPVYVGHVAPLGGPDKDAGEAGRHGVELALREAEGAKGKEGGLDRPVVVLHANAALTPEAFAAEGVRLNTVNHVVALLGGPTAELAAALDQGWIPLVSPAGMRTGRMSDAVHLIGLSPASRGTFLARFALGERGGPVTAEGVAQSVGAGAAPGLPVAAAKGLAGRDGGAPRVALLVDGRRDEYAAAADAFAREWAGKSPDGARPVPWRYADERQLDELIGRVQAEAPDLVFLAGEPDAVRRLRAGAGADLPVLYGGLEGGQAELAAGRRGGAIYLVTAWTPEADTDQNRAFVEQFRSAFGSDPDVHAALAYEATRLLLEGLRKSENFFTSKRINSKLDEIQEFQTLTGAARFDERNALQRRGYLVELHGGRAKVLRAYEPG